jgi:hypothetical protein
MKKEGGEFLMQNLLAEIHHTIFVKNSQLVPGCKTLVSVYNDK